MIVPLLNVLCKPQMKKLIWHTAVDWGVEAGDQGADLYLIMNSQVTTEFSLVGRARLFWSYNFVGLTFKNRIFFDLI